MFAETAGERLVGRVVGPIRWYRPILSVAVGSRRDGEFLTLILESPGPFCFLSPTDPLTGVSAPARFPQLAGATIRGVGRIPGERILRVEAEPAGEAAGPLRLNLLLFGSAGRAELMRGDDTVLQFVGGRLQARAGAPGLRQDPVASGSFYLISRGRLGRVSPAEGDDPAADHRLGPFGDAVEACREVGGRLLEDARRRVVQTRLKPIVRRLGSQTRLADKLAVDLARAEDHERVRREAETLAAFQTRIPPGARSIQLPDPYDPDTTVQVELDPALPLRVQIEKRFKRATKLERSREHTRRRMKEVGHEIETLQRAVDEVGVDTRFGVAGFADALEKIDRAEGDIPGRRQGSSRPSARRKRPETPSFRRFELDETWFVLVGRSNRENDELTFHTASPTDFWFHAQHAAGSHVVLKCRGNPGSPPANIVEAAAAIAAHYSKSRHSGLAPVIYTQRKYVRKPRGAKPGQVVCEREKTVMVAPGIPEPPT